MCVYLNMQDLSDCRGNSNILCDNLYWRIREITGASAAVECLFWSKLNWIGELIDNNETEITRLLKLFTKRQMEK